MTSYIYARVSTKRQEYETQLNQLIARFPDAQVVLEKVSGFKEKPVLMELVGRLQPGDTLIVYALDRLGRRLSEILNLIEALLSKKIKINTLREEFNYENLYSRAMIQMMGVFAELERSLIRQRVRDCIAAKQGRGEHWGKKPVIPKDMLDKACRIVRETGRPVEAVAKDFGFSRRRLYYALASGGVA